MTRRPTVTGVPLLPALVVAVLVWSTVSDLVLTPLTGDLGYVLLNLAATAATLAWVGRAGLDRTALGLRRADLAAGARLGGGAATVVVVALVVALVAGDRLGPLALLLEDDRAALGSGALLFAVVVRIPLGTVVFEEAVFRGALDAAARARLSTGGALTLSAVTFGVYHVPPTLVALRINDVAPLSAAGLGTMAGAVAATTVAGLVFSWLRQRSGSLLAPMRAPLATNVGGLLAATAAQRGVG